MLSLICTIGNKRDLIRTFEDHGIGRKALIKYATSEFIHELKLAQHSANQIQMDVRLELVDQDKGTIMHSTAKPLVISRNPLDGVQQSANIGGIYDS